MEKRITRNRFGILAFVAMFAVHVDAKPPSGPPTEMVILNGWLHVNDLNMENVVLRVEVDGATVRTRVSESGRFVVSLPAGAEARLRFEKPGHLAKEVLVDTRHSKDGGDRHKPRKVKLAVVLELERHMAGLDYAGPVGTLGFEEGGGCVAVEHHRNMVLGQSQKPMVF